MAQVEAGIPFVLTANVPATPTISGLTFNTAYTIYFVAKDAAGNVQAVVQSVAVTTAPTITAGYVTQGGLTWMPITTLLPWASADVYCTTTAINGVTGWRMPTDPELSALYAAYPNSSTALTGLGWLLNNTWSSTLSSTAGAHDFVTMYNGDIGMDYDQNWHLVSCVR